MMQLTAGAAPRLLPIAVAAGLLSACGEQPRAANPEPARTPQREIAEVNALIAATKQHPSLVDPAKNGGAPVQVKLAPIKPAGPAAHHNHAGR